MAQDQPITKAQGDVTADLLKRMGMNVDFVATDWGTVGARRAQKTPHSQGGWEMFHTWHAGADCLSPAGYTAIRGNGDKAWWGWPTSQQVEKEVTAWFAAKSLDEEKAAIGSSQQGGDGRRHLCADGFLPELHGMAQECVRDREGAVALLLGRVEDRVSVR